MAEIHFQDNRFLIRGDLNFRNIMSVYNQSLPQLQQCPELIFDFSQLKSSDSSGLALIMEWIKLCKRMKKPVKFINLPEEMVSIAKAAGMDELFGSY